MQEKDISLAIGSHNYTEYKLYQICFSLPFLSGILQRAMENDSDQTSPEFMVLEPMNTYTSK